MGHYRDPRRSVAVDPTAPNVATNGGSYIMGPSERAVYFNHPATIASFTVRLPAPGDSGDEVKLKFRSAVTTLTLRDHVGAAIPSAPVTVVVGQAVYMRWVDPTIGWMWW